MPRLFALIFAASTLLALQGCSDRMPVSSGTSRLSAQNNSSFSRVGGLSSSTTRTPTGGSNLGSNRNGLQDASGDDYDAVSQAAIDAEIDAGSQVGSNANQNDDAGSDSGSCHASEDQFGCAP